MDKIYKQIIAVAISIALGIAPSGISIKAEISKIITDFAEFDIKEHILQFDAEYKPALNDLLDLMPDTLEVYINEKSETELINVEWFCVGEEYETSERYYFQFSPMWNEEYVLCNDIDLLSEAPYIAVFLTPSDGGLATFSVTGNSNESIIYKYLTETLGYNTAAACGIMANLYCESGFKSTNLQNTYESKLGYTDETYTSAVDSGRYTNFVRDAAGYGLCQWTYWSRKQGLLDFAKTSGTSIGDITMQLNYLKQEIVGKSTGNYMLSVENSAIGAYNAGYYFCEVFERPAQKADEVSIYRGNLARDIYWLEYADNVSDSTTLPYLDVVESDWFHDAVYYSYVEGLMTGIQSTIFAPYNSLSRAQFAVILHRMNGASELEYKTVFPDVSDETWYTDAVLWANKKGIITGYSNGYFGTADNITREQMALMMYRYANSKSYDTSRKVDFDTFKDASKVSDFAKEALRWAVGNNIITGKEGGTVLDPQGNASRAECATIISRFLNTYR